MLSEQVFRNYNFFLKRIFVITKTFISRDKLGDVNNFMHASLTVGYQGKSGPGKIHEVILVY